MKEGEIISRLFIEKNGKMTEIIIRTPKKTDAKDVWKFYNKVIKETQFLSRITPVSLKDERKWLANVLKKMKNGKSVQLFAEHDGRIIASCSVDHADNSESTSHVGHYGICVVQKYTGYGLGTKLTDHILKMSKKIMKLEMVQLSVYSKNKIAQGLYRKMGFSYCGKIPKGFKRGKNYMDNIIMYKVLK
jgi:ribosomal protein S18 acetylase RimI-like enzyme